jgi:hypothetical protein
VAFVAKKQTKQEKAGSVLSFSELRNHGAGAASVN